MKPILIAVALLAGTFTKSFATDVVPAVEPSVLKSFNATFASATEVDWSSTQDFYKAQFALDGRYVDAYYHADGTLMAVTRHISATELPVILQTALKNKYKNQWVSDVFELTKDGSLQYYVTIEDADSKIVLKSVATDWNTYRKERKN